MSDARAIIDFPGTTGAGERLVLQRPAHVIEARKPAEVRAALRSAMQAARGGAWVAGHVAYEAAPAFDPTLATRPGDGIAPLVWFGVFERAAPAESPAHDVAMPAPLDWHAETSPAQYDDAIRIIRDGIASGDVYQVNYTVGLHAACGGIDLRAWYDALVARRHGRYQAFIETEKWAVLSASPELFLDVRDGRVTTRPMKGTLRRGRWQQEDVAARTRLAASPKDRAENLMIVDLLRNDLGRVARFGSVTVPRLFEIETYPTVLQMTSTVTAELRDDVDLDAIFAATFPCGSITGAPKFTAMRAIARLENAPRGPYCGAIGVIRPDGTATFNVAIRTIVVDRLRGIARYGVGGGITWDSLAGAEHDEALAKAALLHDPTAPFRLLETMRLHDGQFARRERHLQRLGESAAYWGFCNEIVDRARNALAREAHAAPRGTWRVRLLANRDGIIETERTAIASADDSTPRDVAIARTAISKHDPLLQHKTTARGAYDRRRAEFPEVFDVLLFNEEGLVTEFTIGNIVVEIGGRRLTPPRDDGLLPGTFRAELLDNGCIVEQPLTLEDVRRAARIWLINSVREWIECRLITPQSESASVRAIVER